jgi:hypothetical protein
MKQYKLRKLKKWTAFCWIWIIDMYVTLLETFNKKLNHYKIYVAYILTDNKSQFFQAQFNEQGRFIHYNMFNHHFFKEDLSKQQLQSFLKNSKQKSLLIVLDPPFGGLVEVLAASVKKMWRLADLKLNGKEYGKVNTHLVYIPTCLSVSMNW